MSKTKGLKKVGLVFAILIFVLPWYFIYTAFYPNESFYVKDFEINTAMVFPASAVIVKKEATYPDIHGAYTSKAIVRLSEQDYRTVYKKLSTDPVFTTDTSSNHFWDDTLEFFEDKDIDLNKITTILIGVRDAQFKIGFVNDGKTIVFERYRS
jgi:hypothetical protein